MEIVEDQEHDPFAEIEAMKSVVEATQNLDSDAMRRILIWLIDSYGIDIGSLVQ